MANLFYVVNGDNQKLSPAVPLSLANVYLTNIQSANLGLFYELRQYFADAPVYKIPDELYVGGK